MMLAALMSLLAGIDLDAGAEVVAIPMLLMGFGIGALASQLGAVAVSALPNERSGEVGGLQNTASNLGISLGTALAGSMLIAALTTSFIAGVQENPDVPDEVKAQASVELAAGVPFISDTALEAAMMDAGVSNQVTEAVVTENRAARIEGLQAALAVLAAIAALSLLFTDKIPSVPLSATGAATVEE
jgi:hypothetical protein